MTRSKIGTGREPFAFAQRRAGTAKGGGSSVIAEMRGDLDAGLMDDGPSVDRKHRGQGNLGMKIDQIMRMDNHGYASDLDRTREGRWLYRPAMAFSAMARCCGSRWAS